MSGALVGLGARSLEVGVEYVKERRAFGVPIGSFQAVSHGLADAATALDGATLLARDGLVGRGRAGRDARAGPPRPSGSARKRPAEATYRSLHYHGGYGSCSSTTSSCTSAGPGVPAQFAEPDVAFGWPAARRLSARVQREPMRAGPAAAGTGLEA